jgi:hypothetical protein
VHTLQDVMVSNRVGIDADNSMLSEFGNLTAVGIVKVVIHYVVNAKFSGSNRDVVMVHNGCRHYQSPIISFIATVHVA